MKWLSFLVAAILLAGCGGNHPTLSPEQVVARGIPRNAQQFQVLVQGAAPDGSEAVVYSYRVPTPADAWPEKFTLGFKTLEFVNNEWQATWTSLGSAPTLVRVRFPI